MVWSARPSSISLSVVLAFLLATPLAVVTTASADGGKTAQPEKTSSPGWLGFGLSPHGGGDGDEPLLLVQYVLPETPAAKGGLKTGDRILAIDDQPVLRFTRTALLDFFLSLKPGQEVKLQIDRKGTRIDLVLVAEVLPSEYRDARKRLERERQQSGG